MKDLRGRDVTEQFLHGAYAALETAKAAGAKTALLKSKSPSCGAGEIYDGGFTGTLREGDGVTAALFKREGIGGETRLAMCIQFILAGKLKNIKN